MERTRTIIERQPKEHARITVGENEHIDYVFFLDREHDENCELEVALKGRGASANAFVFNLGATGASNLSLRLIHEGTDTRGFSWIKSVLGGSARCDMKGMIRIEKGAENANAYFTHKSLLISPDARATTSPMLEIETNSVKASHAATVGHLDRETMFYLLARGIEAREAKELVMLSFACEYLHEIRDETARENIRAILEEKVHALA